MINILGLDPCVSDMMAFQLLPSLSTHPIWGHTTKQIILVADASVSMAENYSLTAIS